MTDGYVPDPVEVSVVANAIGYAMFSYDRDTVEKDGVQTVEITAEEAVRVRAAAERALRALDHERSKAEEDEPIEDIRRAWREGEKGVTREPGTVEGELQPAVLVGDDA